MSSVPAYELLQITVPRAEVKQQPSESSKDGQFQNVLARASSAAEGEPNRRAESHSEQRSNNRLKDSSDRDASAQYDEASTESDTATEPVDSPDEKQPDVVELSPAVQSLLGTQLVPEEVLSVDGEEQLLVGASVIDAPTVENHESQVGPEAEAVSEQFAKSFEVNLPTIQQAGLVENVGLAKTDAAVVETVTGADTLSQENQHLQALELSQGSEQQPVADTAGENLFEETPERSAGPSLQLEKPVVVDEHPQSAVDPTSVAGHTVIGQSATQQGNSVVADELNKAKSSSDRESVSDDLTEARVRPSESELLKAQSVSNVTDSVVKDTASEQSIPNLPTHTNHLESNAASTASRLTTGPTGEIPQAENTNLDSDPIQTVDRARFVQRIGRAFQSAHARDGQIQLRLSPPELGSLRIAISVQEGVVSAKIETETAAARNILLDNLPALRERLAEQEIRIEKFDVDVPREGRQEPGSSGAEDRQSRDSQEPSSDMPPTRELESKQRDTPSENINPVDRVAAGALDVRI